MRKYIFIGAVIFSLVGFVTVSASAPQDCQYPDRLTNPAGGCDNSDPACVEEIKGGVCPPPQQPAAQQTAPIIPVTPHSTSEYETAINLGLK